MWKHLVFCVLLSLSCSAKSWANDIFSVLGKESTRVSAAIAKQTDQTPPLGSDIAQDSKNQPMIDDIDISGPKLSSSDDLKTDPIDPADQFALMKSFVAMKQAKENQITLLNLEIERKERELKSLELQSKINQIKKSQDTQGFALPDVSAAQKKENLVKTATKDVTVTYILFSDSYQEAEIQVDGKKYSGRKGETIAEHIEILDIAKRSVKVLNNSKEQVLHLN